MTSTSTDSETNTGTAWLGQSVTVEVKLAVFEGSVKTGK